MSAPPSAWRIAQAMAAAQAMRASLLAEDAGLDAATLADCIDGELDALDLVRRLVRYSLDAKSMATAAAARADDILRREARFKRHAEAARATALAMLEALDMAKLVAEDFTVSISQGKPGVIVTDAALLEPRFVRTTTSTAPDKASIAAAMDAGETVQGAERSNGSSVFTVRVK